MIIPIDITKTLNGKSLETWIDCLQNMLRIYPDAIIACTDYEADCMSHVTIEVTTPELFEENHGYKPQ